MRYEKFLAIFLMVALPVLLQAQVTTSNITGTVTSTENAKLAGATVTATHVPTGTVYKASVLESGSYGLYNVRSGGPYTVKVEFVGYAASEKSDIQLTLGENFTLDFVLSQNAQTLQEVVVSTISNQKNNAGGGAETTIGRDKMANLPTVGRNMSDYLRYIPQAKVTSDGGISIAGQNNRYNSFYIDGATNNDAFGLAASGTNGGQAGIAPISIDAIDQFQVVVSPYDATLGNFTGGGINAITKSGTNDIQASAYYFFRNQNLSGKTPGADKDEAIKLPDFSNKTYGARIGGPIIKNKLFYFANIEWQRDERPQPQIDPYSGAITASQLDELSTYLKNTYGYDPGGYMNNPEKVQANRIVGKIDWNINDANKLSVSFRHTDGFRNNVSRSSSSTINFYNNGYVMPNKTNSGSVELNSRFAGNKSNRLLLTFTNVKDDRGPLGGAFPRVQIQDGSNNVYFGTEEFSTANLLKQNNYALFDVFKMVKDRHSLSFGTDNELSYSYNIFIRQNYGSYIFSSLDNFYAGTATTYNRSYSLVDPGVTGDGAVNAAAEFNTLRLGLFASDEFKVSNRLTLTFGVRLDNTSFLTTPKTDAFFNDTALSIISGYYDLEGAKSGQISSPKLAVNPRFGFTYKIPESGLTIRGGAGTFSGRVPLVWPGGVYNNNGIVVAGTRGSDVAFRPDPFDQYTAADFGATVSVPSGEINLISKDFKMNKVFRTSVAVDKTFGKGWRATVEGIYTANINEIKYTRIDILPPTKEAAGADNRNVYDLNGSFPLSIPLRSDGTSPYTGVYLLSNNEDKKGYSYNISVTLNKNWANGFSANANYVYGRSMILNEGTSSQNSSQWRYMETVNGRNYMGLSRSDFDLGHRIFAYVSKKFTYANKALATTVSLVYNGQSGSPYSFVMNRGMVRDYDNNESNDLIYIPRNASEITFVQNGDLTPEAQWDLFNQYIENDKYLSKHRGEYAERNGARLPFVNIVDFKLQQDFNLKVGGKTYQLQLTYDIFNFTNFLNRNWGKQYFISNDQALILNMAGYVSSTDLTPTYTFTPSTGREGKVYDLSDGVYNSSRWTSQIGLRISLF